MWVRIPPGAQIHAVKPEGATVIPPQVAMLTLAETLEKVADKDGWDQKPSLSTIYRHSGVAVEGVDADLFHVIAFPAQPHQISANPGQGLMFMAGRMLIGDCPPIIPPHRQNDFAGVAFVCEGWLSFKTLEERKGRRIADTPDGKEVRFAHLIDCAGRYYHVTRIRGEEPHSEVALPGDTETRVVGTIAIGLRDMMHAIGRQLPLGSMDLDAVRAIGAESLDDLVQGNSL
jgi:hypothetical protein